MQTFSFCCFLFFLSLFHSFFLSFTLSFSLSLFLSFRYKYQIKPNEWRMNEYEKSAGCHYCRFNTISFCISERVKLKQNLSVVRLEMTDPFRSRVTPYHNIAYRVVGDTERAVSSTDAASPPATAMNPSSNKDRLTLTR